MSQLVSLIGAFSYPVSTIPLFGFIHCALGSSDLLVTYKLAYKEIRLNVKIWGSWTLPLAACNWREGHVGRPGFGE
jgi:hypothetical protein